MRNLTLLLGLFIALGAMACASDSSGGAKQGAKNTNILDDGLPDWVDDPCVGQPVGALCAVGESDLAATDVEMAKTDAETSAKNRIVDQLRTNVNRLTERLNTAMKDLSGGRVVGQKSLKDINRNFVEQELVGLRYAEYFYYPDRVAPEKIWVRAVLAPNNAKVSQDIVDAMLQSAKVEELELNHEEAMVRFKQVRDEYLGEVAPGLVNDGAGGEG